MFNMAGNSHSEHERAHDNSGQDQHHDVTEYVERYLQDYSGHKQHNKESEHEQHSIAQITIISRTIRSTSNAINRGFQTMPRQARRKISNSI